MALDNLTAQVKRKLNITWEDADTDARVAEIMADVTPYLLHRLGITDAAFDFSAPGMECDLFKACCLYEWNHVPRDEFEQNYRRTLAYVRDRHTVAYYAAQEEMEGETDEDEGV